MSPLVHMPIAQDIPKFDIGHWGEHSPKQVAREPNHPVQSSKRQSRPETRVTVHRRSTIPSEHRQDLRGRSSRTISNAAMSRSKSEHLVRRLREDLPGSSDSSDSDSDGTEGQDSSDSERGRTKASSRLSVTASAKSGSGSSSGSASTITETGFAKRDKTSDVPEPKSRPDALSFLEKDSPAITEEAIQRAAAQASGAWSPRSTSSTSSSGSGSQPSDGSAETNMTSPDHSIDGDAMPAASNQSSATDSGSHRRLQGGEDAKSHRYGTPEMSRGSVKHPHLPPNELTQRVTNPGHAYAKHLPRAEKLPLTGYELLAHRLSSQGARPRRHSGSSRSVSPTEDSQQPIKPIYRRFEALNHRLLLHLQDELSELEEQLHRLDTADTQTRRLQNSILPASRRRETMAGGELQWHKTDILGKIGYKLGQYNHALSSFTETQNLSPASIDDVEEYRTYLTTEHPIAEIETRFLDPTDDLVCLASASRASSLDRSSAYSAYSDDALTPMPGKMTFGPSSPGNISRPSTRASSRQEDSSTTEPQSGQSPKNLLDGSILPATAASVAFSLPVVAGFVGLVSLLTFPFFTDFAGRLAVVLVTTIAISTLKRNMELGQ